MPAYSLDGFTAQTSNKQQTITDMTNKFKEFFIKENYPMKGKIFNAQEVQAILAGNKTMFREVIKPQPKKDVLEYTADRVNLLDKCPYQVGQKIFCKERLFNDGDQFFYDDEDGTILDKKDEKFWERNCSKHTIPAKNCPQWASRLTLLIKEIRVERLDLISDKDALKEGCFYEGGCEVPRISFKMDWNATHKKPEEKWEANPWIWVINFEVVNANK